jgi:hypothetical protein
MAQRAFLPTIVALALGSTVLVTLVPLAGVADDAAAIGPKGEGVVAKVEGQATVTQIDHATRAVTLRRADGQETSFVAGADVRNLEQVKVGDIVSVEYAEALVYEVHKGGTAAAPSVAVAEGRSEPGKMPGGAVAQQRSVTVLVTAIDPAAPSITFQGASGESRTIKVQRPERLKDVSVGDTVTLTYTEALAIKVDKAPAP